METITIPNKSEILPIGSTGYPIDNSYSHTINSRENPFLAGWLDSKKHKAKKVTIVSLPYHLVVREIGGVMTKYEFVTVSYNRKCHVVLNEFENITKPKVRILE